MKHIFLSGLAIAFALASVKSFACHSDSDCGGGQYCAVAYDRTTNGVCINAPTRSYRDTIGGAVIGGAAGRALTKGSTGGTVGGAIVGGLIGNHYDKQRYNNQLSLEDQAHDLQRQQQQGGSANSSYSSGYSTDNNNDQLQGGTYSNSSTNISITVNGADISFYTKDGLTYEQYVDLNGPSILCSRPSQVGDKTPNRGYSCHGISRSLTQEEANSYAAASVTNEDSYVNAMKRVRITIINIQNQE